MNVYWFAILGFAAISRVQNDESFTNSDTPLRAESKGGNFIQKV